jgi:hypothetical protein
MQASVLIGVAMLVSTSAFAQAPAAEPEPAMLAVDGPSTSVSGGDAAPAQPATSALDQLRRALGKGDRVSVTRTDAMTWHGRVVRVGADGLEIATRALEGTTGRRKLNLSIPLETIQSLERPRDSSQNGALIGAGVGAAVGLSMFAYLFTVDRNEMDEWGSEFAGVTVVTAGIGAIVGWAIDAVHSKPHFVYHAERPQARRIDVVPIHSHGPGLGIAVRF